MLLFPSIFQRPMMISFVTLFVSIDLFQFIENRICTGINGKDDCCFGFSLDITTGKCERCSNGYFGSDCSQKCIHPTYGEDCQYICQCLEIDCHYSYGCSQKMGTISQTSSSKMMHAETILTTSTTVSMSNKTFTEDTTIFIHQISATTVNNHPKSNELGKNDVFVGFFGAFVLFFIVFVVANIYRKFFQKKLHTSKFKESEWHAQYQSLNVGAVGIHGMANPGPQERLVNTEPSYLSPVFNRNESDDTGDVQGHDIRHEHNVISRELNLSRQRLIHDSTYAENGLDVFLDDRADHVYIEIAENSEENLNLTVDNDNESDIVSNNESITALNGSIVYMNQ